MWGEKEVWKMKGSVKGKFGLWKVRLILFIETRRAKISALFLIDFKRELFHPLSVTCPIHFDPYGFEIIVI